MRRSHLEDEPTSGQLQKSVYTQSLETERSLQDFIPQDFKDDIATAQKRPSMQLRKSFSTESLKTERSIDIPLEFKDDIPTPQKRPPMQLWKSFSTESLKTERSIDIPLEFKDDIPTPQKSQRFTPDSHLSKESGQDIENKVLSLQKREETADDDKEEEDVLLENLKFHLKEKFQFLNEGSTNQGSRMLLKKIFVHLFITEGGSEKPDRRHEIAQIETTSGRLPSGEMQIKCNEIFQALPGQIKPIRSVLTKGVAGIGKTVSIQKFILDWTEREANTDVHLIFPLPFRELNLMKGKKLSLTDLLTIFFSDTKNTQIFSKKYNIIFIFDGLDECRLTLDFQKSVHLSDVTETTSLEVLMTNLIMGNLLPSAHIWITSRPLAADQIPSEYIDRVTEIQGFSDSQKEEYFRKKTDDDSLATRIITHMKSSRTLFAMCQIPVFCWIAATVLERTLSEGEIPKTLTQMYTHFLFIQKKKRKVEDGLILKLGQLAFHQLVKGNLIFYEEDLRDCGIDVSEASALSMVCTEFFKEQFGQGHKKCYTFIHLSVQEHLAALYVHSTFVTHNEIVFEQSLLSRLQSCINTATTISDVHRIAVDMTLSDKTGHLDLFLRFLLGLSLESNQSLLQGMLTHTGSSSYNKRKTIVYIKQKIRENPPVEKYINLFHCLNELGDTSIAKEVQSYLKEGKIKRIKLSSSDWSALVFVLTTVESLNEFELSKYTTAHMSSEEVLLKLLPVVKTCRAADFTGCSLAKKSCAALASVLSSGSSNLRQLKLNWNDLQCSGVKLLSSGLGSDNCRLVTLELSRCGLEDEGCRALSSALISNPSHLRELDLSKNELKDAGVQQLSVGLQNLDCKLEKLNLVRCKVEGEGCFALASALMSNPSHLKHLDLSENEIGDSGVIQLAPFLENPLCRMETLRLWGCKITEKGCAILASVLRSNPSHLRQLDLCKTTIKDTGLKLLCDELKKPQCTIEILRLRYCGFTDEGCLALVSALKSNPSHLKEVNLSGNELNEGKKHIFALRDDPHYKLHRVTFYEE